MPGLIGSLDTGSTAGQNSNSNTQRMVQLRKLLSSDNLHSYIQILDNNTGYLLYLFPFETTAISVQPISDVTTDIPATDGSDGNIAVDIATLANEGLHPDYPAQPASFQVTFTCGAMSATFNSVTDIHDVNGDNDLSTIAIFHDHFCSMMQIS